MRVHWGTDSTVPIARQILKNSEAMCPEICLHLSPEAQQLTVYNKVLSDIEAKAEPGAKSERFC